MTKIIFRSCDTQRIPMNCYFYNMQKVTMTFHSENGWRNTMIFFTRKTGKRLHWLAHSKQLSYAGRGFLLHTEDGVGPCGPMTRKEENLMFTPPQMVWVRVDPHFYNSNLVSASAEVV